MVVSIDIDTDLSPILQYIRETIVFNIERILDKRSLA